MLDTTKIQQHIITDLKKRGHSEQEIAQMTPREAYIEFCEWNALRGWGQTLWATAENLQQADVGIDRTKPIMDFVRSLLIEVGGTDDGCTPVIDDLLAERITAYAEFYAKNVQH